MNQKSLDQNLKVRSIKKNKGEEMLQVSNLKLPEVPNFKDPEPEPEPIYKMKLFIIFMEMVTGFIGIGVYAKSHTLEETYFFSGFLGLILTINLILMNNKGGKL
ncbi:MAG: hypothetical protein KDK36_22080 [Leptospiraceae bacterium]|nr:hypothetical protein [Leptospiraceae bacterium]